MVPMAQQDLPGGLPQGRPHETQAYPGLRRQTEKGSLLFTILSCSSSILLRPESGTVFCDEYCVYVCLFLSTHSHISQTTWSNFTELSVNVDCGRGSVLLCRLCDRLCTSGFVDDVISNNGSTARCVAMGHEKHNSRDSSRILFIDKDRTYSL